MNHVTASFRRVCGTSQPLRGRADCRVIPHKNVSQIRSNVCDWFRQYAGTAWSSLFMASAFIATRKNVMRFIWNLPAAANFKFF